MLSRTQIDNVDYILQYATDIYSDENKAQFFYSDSISDLQVGIYVNDETKNIIVSFRGTTSTEDKMTDLRIAQAKYTGKIYVHSGFYDQLFKSCVYQEFYNKLIELIESNSYDIFITGHSLGAALASLFGFRLATSIDKCIKIITFASPKVGNYYWKRAFDSKCNIINIRVAVSTDPIVIVPFLNYYHVSGVLYLNTGKFFYQIKDHSTMMYDKLIKKKKTKLEMKEKQVKNNDKYFTIFHKIM